MEKLGSEVTANWWKRIVNEATSHVELRIYHTFDHAGSFYIAYMTMISPCVHVLQC